MMNKREFETAQFIPVKIWFDSSILTGSVTPKAIGIKDDVNVVDFESGNTDLVNGFDLLKFE